MRAYPKVTASMALGLEFPDGELERSLNLGIPTDRGVRAWLRAPGTDEVTVTLQVGQSSAIATARPDTLHDWIATVDLELPGDRSGEAFTVTVEGMQRSGHFAPATRAPSAFTFAFGSCHQPFEPNAGTQLSKHEGAGLYGPALGVMREHEVRFLMLVGDQVYSDGVEGQSVRDWARSRSPGNKPSLSEYVDAYRHLYRGYFNERGFRALLDEYPARMIWDDHDIGDSWGSRFVEDDEDRLTFQAASQAYREYQRSRQQGAAWEDTPPYHGGFRYGDTAFWVMDARGVRSWEAGRVLGDAQIEATARFLAEIEAEGLKTLFVVATVPLVHFSPAIVKVLQWVPGGKGSDVRDRWDAAPFHEERDTVIDMLSGWQHAEPGRQVIVLSGDVHAGAAFVVRDRVTGGHFRQWTSSSLSAPGGAVHSFVNRLGTRLVNVGENRCDARRIGIDPRNNVGLIHVEPTEGGSHRVTFDLYARAPGGQMEHAIRDIAAVGSSD